jgi:hypothetical protein
MLMGVAAKDDVVLVDYPPAPVTVPASSRVHRLESATDDNALEIQTSVIAQASAFVGSHGALGTLAAFCGKPTLTYHSERLPVDEVDRFKAASESAGWGPLVVERARRFKGVRVPTKVHA